MSKIDLSKALVFPSAITGGFMVGDWLVILNGSLVAIIPRGAVNTARNPEPMGVPAVKAERQDTHPAPVVVEASVDPRWPGGPPLTPHIGLPTKEAILGVLKSKGPTRTYYIGNALGIPIWAHDIRADLSRKIKLLLSSGDIDKVEDSGRLPKYKLAKNRTYWSQP
jgi:hypothetical protein